MHIDFFPFDHVHLLGDSAMRPIAPCSARHAALLTLQALWAVAHCVVTPCLAHRSRRTLAHPTAVASSLSDSGLLNFFFYIATKSIATC